MDDFIPGFDDPEDEESGYFDDDGNRLNPDLITKPGLCLLCGNDDDPHMLVECNLTRLGQVDENDEFKCGMYKARDENL
jgi:hypothetical protein